MTTPDLSKPLSPLVTRLKTCPSQESTLSESVLIETWGYFRRLPLECAAELTPAIMAGLILYDKHFAQLLNEAERSQMIALARLALERFEQKVNPPNKLGKIIAASLKEKST